MKIKIIAILMIITCLLFGYRYVEALKEDNQALYRSATATKINNEHLSVELKKSEDKAKWLMQQNATLQQLASRRAQKLIEQEHRHHAFLEAIKKEKALDEESQVFLDRRLPANVTRLLKQRTITSKNGDHHRIPNHSNP